MILEKLNEMRSISESLKNAGLSYAMEYYVTDIKKLKKGIEQGKWAVLTYNCVGDSTGTDDLRIIPYLQGTDWPEVYTMPYMETATRFKNLAAKYIDLKIQVCYKKRTYCEKLFKEWDDLYESTIPFYKLFGGNDDLALLKEVVFSKALWASEDYAPEEEYLPRVRQMKLKIDPSPENHYLYELIDKYNDSEYLPEMPTIDLGIYENRILSMIASRAYIMSQYLPFEQLVNLLLQAVNFSHGFDKEGSNVMDRPSSSETILSVFNPLEILFFEPNLIQLNNDIKQMPEFYIAQKMFEKKGGYNGTAHLEMAALYDEQLNDGKTAWKHLVSAGYWAGKNLPEAQPKIIEQAMLLCNKYGWVEAQQVLAYNLNILNS